MRQSRRMAKTRVVKEGWRCERCGHEWIPRDKKTAPITCPKCRSPYWNRPRRAKRST